MSDSVGFVVIEYNQASHLPELHLPYLYSQDEAEQRAAEAREETAHIGRKERYAVAEVTLLDEEYPR